MGKKLSIHNSKSLFSELLIIMIVIFGIMIRLKGLGKWPFGSTDEYFMAKSVENILASGFPKFKLGGYYVRGLVNQYLSVVLILLGFKEEFALRFIPVIFNIMSIPALYFLSKKISKKVAVYFVIIFFVLSTWEVEFSRFARMYAPFQAIFIWYVFFFYKIIIEYNQKYWSPLYLLSFLSIFVYEGGIFLILLNFFSIIYHPIGFSKKVLIKRSIVSFGLLIVAYSYLSFDFMGQRNISNLPNDLVLVHNSVGKLEFPIILLKFFPNHPNWILIFLLLFVLSIIGIRFILKNTQFPLITKVIFILLLLLSLFNLFGLLALLILLFFSMNWIKLNDIKSKFFKFSLIIYFVNFIYWVVFGLYINDWHSSFDKFQSIQKLKKLLLVLIDYPHVYNNIVEEYIEVMPIFIISISVIIGIGIYVAFKDKYANQKGFRIFLSLIVLHFIFIGILRTPYHSTRYTFFLYPLILIVFISSLEKIWYKFFCNLKRANLFFVFSILFFLFISEDINFNHLLNIDSREVNFRMDIGLNSPQAAHYIRRFDVRTPAKIVNQNMKTNDIIIITFLTAEYYLKRVDYIYYDYRRKEFRNYSRSHGNREVWTNAKLIWKESDLFKLLTTSPNTIWLISYSVDYKNSSEAEKKISQLFGSQNYYTSLGKMVVVYKIEHRNQFEPHSKIRPPQ